MSLIGNPDTPQSYVADYMQACVGMFGIPAGGFTSDIETYGAATSYDVESLYAAMLNSSIGRSIYAPGISNESFASKLVDKVGGGLLSDADKAAAVDEVQALLDGGVSQAATAMAVVEFVAGLETSDATYGAVAQQFQNRIEIANYYTFSSAAPSSTLSTLTSILSPITNATDVSDPAKVLQDNNVTTGSSFTLTTGQDYADTSSSFKNGGLIASDFKFTTGNETVTAGAGTLGNTDALVDGSTADADVLNATLTSGAASTTTIQNIETINLTTTIAGSGLDFANVMGAKAVTLTGTANTSLTSVNSNAAPTIEVKDFSKVLTLSTATLAGTTAAGTADSLSVKLTNVAAGGTATSPIIPGLVLDTAVAGALETLNLESAGTTKNTLDLSLDAAGVVPTGITKTVVTGAADLDLRVTQTLITGQTLDASGHTGVLNLFVDRNGATTAATNLTNVSGVDTYTFRDSVATGDAVVASGLGDGSTVVLTYATTGASSLAVKGAASSTTNVLNVTVDNATDATDTAIATSLTIADVETINIKSEGGTSTGNSIAALTVNSGSKVTVDGATKMDLQLAAASTVTTVEVKGAGAHKVDFAAGATYLEAKTLTIDGAAATGKLTLDGSDFTGTAGGVAESLTINGGSNDDTITATADANSKNIIDAGAGVDTVTVTTANASNVTLGAGADKVTINTVAGTAAVTFTDFTLGSGGDVLSVNTAAGMTLGANGTASANNQLVIQTAAVADNTAAAALVSGTATAEAAIIVINNATGVAELWYDADGTAGGEVKLASFENITTVGALTDATSGFIAANFGTWA